VIASNRRYMRGAGTADHTADRAKNLPPRAEAQSRLETMRTCALTGAPLESSIVACPHGKLYSREAAIEALLRRSRAGEEIPHVRNLRDLHVVRFERREGRIVCPVTGVDLNGTQPAFCTRGESVNVVSERAVKEMGVEGLQAEYGPFEERDLIRLAPSARELIGIKERLEEERSKKKKNKKKKSKEQGTKSKRVKITGVRASCKSEVAVNTARSSVASAVQSNAVLSSLFVTHDTTTTQKEKNDNLFAR